MNNNIERFREIYREPGNEYRKHIDIEVVNKKEEDESVLPELRHSSTPSPWTSKLLFPELSASD